MLKNKVACRCKRTKCKRHGNCEECRAFHKNSKEHPLPACIQGTPEDMEERIERCIMPLVTWYRRNARTLPWREKPEPYRVWISEIMLQQTRVEAVRPYFERFMAELPSIAALAAVEDDRLMKLWEGLGYYSRARNLKKAAQEVVERYGAQLPASHALLLELPGIGPYTAGAIASIAFGIPVPAVDGNVLRVITRIAAFAGDIGDAKTKKTVTEALQRVMPDDCPGDFNQALMELGATVCIPNGAPLCEECPVYTVCRAAQEGWTDELPVRAPKKERTIEKKTVLVVTDGERTAIRRRRSSGLLAGMWEFPNADGYLTEAEAEKALEQMGIKAEAIRPLPAAKHIFTHKEWHMSGYIAEGKMAAENKHIVWADMSEIAGTYALPSAFRAFAAQLRDYMKHRIE